MLLTIVTEIEPYHTTCLLNEKIKSVSQKCYIEFKGQNNFITTYNIINVQFFSIVYAQFLELGKAPLFCNMNV